MGNTLCNGVYDVACYEIGAVLWPVAVCVCVSMFQLNSPMNSVSSTEDIKPPLGINGVMKVPAQPSGTSLSLSKHICTICGDRSSGELQTNYCCNLLQYVAEFFVFFIFFVFHDSAQGISHIWKFAYAKLPQLSHRNSGVTLLKISIVQFHMTHSLAKVLWEWWCLILVRVVKKVQ